MGSCSRRCRRESQTSDISAPNAFVVFNDPAFGPNGSHYLDTVLQAMPPAQPMRSSARRRSISPASTCRTSPAWQGVEALYIYRPAELPLGGTVEFTAGGRYLELKDQFWVDARGGNLTDSYWNTTSHNEIARSGNRRAMVPAVRAVRHFGRGPFHGGRQCPVGQPGRRLGLRIGRRPECHRPPAGDPNGQTTSIQYPTLMGATELQHSTHWVEFSPIIELRVEAHMQLTNIIAVKAGYTGIFVNNVVRAADMVNYTVPNMGITRNLDGNLQPVYIQGLNLSIEFNR